MAIVGDENHNIYIGGYNVNGLDGSRIPIVFSVSQIYGQRWIKKFDAFDSLISANQIS